MPPPPPSPRMRKAGRKPRRTCAHKQHRNALLRGNMLPIKLTHVEAADEEDRGGDGRHEYRGNQSRRKAEHSERRPGRIQCIGERASSLNLILTVELIIFKMSLFLFHRFWPLTEASRVRCSVDFLQIFLKEVAAREQFSAAVSLLYTALLKVFARLHLRYE